MPAATTSGPADAEIIWDDSPGRSDRSEARRAAAAWREWEPGPRGEQFWEEDVNRAAAARSADTTDRRREKPGATTDPPAAHRPRHRCPERPDRQAKRTSEPGDRTSDVAVEASRPVDAPAPAEWSCRARRKRPSRLSVVLVVVPLLVIATVAWRYLATAPSGIPR